VYGRQITTQGGAARRRQPTEGKDDMGKRFAIVIGVAAAGVMALGAQTAAAPSDVVKYDTRLTIARMPHCCRYNGDVKSEVKKCIDGRRVVLFRQGRKVGTARSNENGVWGLDDRGPGRWYAKVRREVHDEFVCKKDRTATKPLTK
jgi:hypothetical protein